MWQKNGLGVTRTPHRPPNPRYSKAVVVDLPNWIQLRLTRSVFQGSTHLEQLICWSTPANGVIRWTHRQKWILEPDRVETFRMFPPTPMVEPATQPLSQLTWAKFITRHGWSLVEPAMQLRKWQPPMRWSIVVCLSQLVFGTHKFTVLPLNLIRRSPL